MPWCSESRDVPPDDGEIAHDAGPWIIRRVHTSSQPMQEHTPEAAIFWIGVVVVWAVFVGASTCDARDDVQSWNALEISKHIGPEWEVFFLPEIRIRDDASELFYHEYRQGVRWKHFKHLYLGMNYLFIRDESSGEPREEHTGELEVIPRATIGPCTCSFRTRVELRTIQGSPGEQEWRVRLMPKLAFPTQLAGHKLTPFVSDEVFYDYSRDAWNQNRVVLGVAVPLGKTHGLELSTEVYYMLQNRLGSRHDWNSTHVLGTKWAVRF